MSNTEMSNHFTSVTLGNCPEAFWELQEIISKLKIPTYRNSTQLYDLLLLNSCWNIVNIKKFKKLKPTFDKSNHVTC